MEHLEEDAKTMMRFQEKRKRVNEALVQDILDKACRNEELRKLEEGLPRLKEEIREKAARSYKAAVVV